MLLSKATYSVFSLYMFLSVHVFPGNRTHNLCAANAMLYHWAKGPHLLWPPGWVMLCSWGHFGRSSTPGTVHCWSKFPPFVYNGSDRGSLESQSLRNGFITLSRLIHLNSLVSHLFLNFFRSRRDLLLFKHALLCQIHLDSTGLAVIRSGCV